MQFFVRPFVLASSSGGVMAASADTHTLAKRAGFRSGDSFNKFKPERRHQRRVDGAAMAVVAAAAARRGTSGTVPRTASLTAKSK